MNPWLIIGSLATVIGAFFYGQHIGQQSVTVKWEAERIKISEAARVKEQSVNQSIGKLQDELLKQTTRRAIAERTLDNRLREFQAAISRANEVSPAASSPNGVGTGEVLGACAAELVGLAKETDRLAEKVTGLQTYVKDLQ